MRIARRSWPLGQVPESGQDRVQYICNHVHFIYVLRCIQVRSSSLGEASLLGCKLFAAAVGKALHLRTRLERCVLAGVSVRY